MSRIGKQPITVPAGVEVKIGTDVVEVKGPKGLRWIMPIQEYMLLKTVCCAT